MPTARENFGLTTSQNKIYAISGAVDDRGVNEVYDIVTDTWETKTPLPSARECFDANAVNGKIYVIGGRQPILTGGYSYFNDNWVYDIETDVWSNKNPSPIDIKDYASAVIDNKIYILTYDGGLYESVCSLLIYDTNTDKWSQGANMPASVHEAVMGATTGKIAPKQLYVMSMDLDAVQIYDPATNKWSTGTQMPTERLGFSIAVLNDNIYAIGGTGISGTDVNEMYTPTTGYKTTNLQINIKLVVTVIIVIIVIAVVAIIIWLKTRQKKKNIVLPYFITATSNVCEFFLQRKKSVFPQNNFTPQNRLITIHDFTIQTV
jgi:N-acetylneuraminic acid mutarotase